jgi:hypothetical protein
VTAEQRSVEREVARLASERTALFSRSGTGDGLTATEQGRLRAIERELDEQYLALRQMRAARDGARFAYQYPIARRAVTARRNAGPQPDGK